MRQNQGNHDNEKRTSNHDKEKKNNEDKNNTTRKIRIRSVQGEDNDGNNRQSDINKAKRQGEEDQDKVKRQGEGHRPLKQREAK